VKIIALYVPAAPSLDGAGWAERRLEALRAAAADTLLPQGRRAEWIGRHFQPLSALATQSGMALPAMVAQCAVLDVGALEQLPAGDRPAPGQLFLVCAEGGAADAAAGLQAAQTAVLAFLRALDPPALPLLIAAEIAPADDAQARARQAAQALNPFFPHDMGMLLDREGVTRLLARPDIDVNRILSRVLGEKIELTSAPVPQMRSETITVRDPAVADSIGLLLAGASGRRIAMASGRICEPDLVIGNRSAWAVPLHRMDAVGVAELGYRHLHPGSTQRIILQPDVCAALGEQGVARLAGRLDWMVVRSRANGGLVLDCPDAWGVVIDRAEQAALAPRLLASHIRALQAALELGTVPGGPRVFNHRMVSFVDEAAERYPAEWLPELADRLQANIALRCSDGVRIIAPRADVDPRQPAFAAAPLYVRTLPPAAVLHSELLAPAAAFRQPGREPDGPAEAALTMDARAVAYVIAALELAGFPAERRRVPDDARRTLYIEGPPLAAHLAQLVADVSGHRVECADGARCDPNLVLGNHDTWAVPLTDLGHIETLAARFLKPGSRQAVVLRPDVLLLLHRAMPAVLRSKHFVAGLQPGLKDLANRLGRPVVALPPPLPAEDSAAGLATALHLRLSKGDAAAGTPPDWPASLTIHYPQGMADSTATSVLPHTERTTIERTARPPSPVPATAPK
jgi:hypothetical protein